VDEIFIIHDLSKLNMNDLIHTLDRFHIDVSFNPTIETEGHIQFLALLIICKYTTTERDIF